MDNYLIVRVISINGCCGERGIMRDMQCGHCSGHLAGSAAAPGGASWEPRSLLVGALEERERERERERWGRKGCYIILHIHVY